MISHLKYIHTFCMVLGYWEALSSLAEGLLSRLFWRILFDNKSDHRDMLKRHISGHIHAWSKAEQRERRDKDGSVVIFICGFVIYAYAFSEDVDELFRYTIKMVDNKMRLLS